MHPPHPSGCAPKHANTRAYLGLFPSYSPTWGRRLLNTHVDCKKQGYPERSHPSAECACRLCLQSTHPLHASVGQLLALCPTPSDYSLPPGGPTSFPGLCCEGDSALGCPLDRAVTVSLIHWLYLPCWFLSLLSRLPAGARNHAETQAGGTAWDTSLPPRHSHLSSCVTIPQSSQAHILGPSQL